MNIGVPKITGLSPEKLSIFLEKLLRRGELESFFQEAVQKPDLLAYLSYWEKWYSSEIQEKFEVAIKKEKVLEKISKKKLPLGLEEKFSSDEIRIIFSNVGAIQLTFGCSGGCPYCGLDALPGLKESLPFEQLIYLFKCFGKEISNTKPLLYWASEPKDYSCFYHGEEKTYEDVHQLSIKYADHDAHITSRITDDDKWLHFLSREPGENRVSVFGLDKNATDKIEKKTSARLYGRNQEHRVGIGLSSKEAIYSEENQKGYDGIGCFNGLLVTPRGMYNIFQIPSSKQYPQGQIILPVERLSGREVREGDSLLEILKNSVVCYQKLWIGISCNCRLEHYLLPFITINNGVHEYDLAVDEKLIIKKAIPSIRSKKNEKLFWKRVEELKNHHKMYSHSILPGDLMYYQISFEIKRNSKNNMFYFESNALTFYYFLDKYLSLPIRYKLVSAGDLSIGETWTEGEIVKNEELYKKYGNFLKLKAVLCNPGVDK